MLQKVWSLSSSEWEIENRLDKQVSGCASIKYRCWSQSSTTVLNTFSCSWNSAKMKLRSPDWFSTDSSTYRLCHCQKFIWATGCNPTVTRNQINYSKTVPYSFFANFMQSFVKQIKTLRNLNITFPLLLIKAMFWLIQLIQMSKIFIEKEVPVIHGVLYTYF